MKDTLDKIMNLMKMSCVVRIAIGTLIRYLCDISLLIYLYISEQENTKCHVSLC